MKLFQVSLICWVTATKDTNVKLITSKADNDTNAKVDTGTFIDRGINDNGCEVLFVWVIYN